MEPKYIFITGGVVSSLGKGITSASIALLLETRGLKVAMLKLDPYLNVDPGTMNPFQHGEVYVTDDGAETDLDLGHYFRFTNASLTRSSNATSGQIYETVIKGERRGDYLGQTVQVIPHVTEEIKRRIIDCTYAQEKTDVVLVEIGGTVGDIESQPFLEAIRQFRHDHRGKCINIHLTYVPFLKAAGEVKTKPSQHSVQILREIGIMPDILICRCEEPLSEEIKEKLSLFCSVEKEAVIDEVDVAHSIYEVPLTLKDQGLDDKISSFLNLPQKKVDLSSWKEMLSRMLNPKHQVVIGIVGKYMQHQDAYKSVFEALEHAAVARDAKLVIRRFESEILDKEPIDRILEGCDACLVPGGFGSRGWQGMILTAKYCREKSIPYFGLCLGMQVMCVDFARHVLGLSRANSTEMDSRTPDPVISLLSEQQGVDEMGGSMRLGAYPCLLQEGSIAAEAYKTLTISERHRHRYEFNNCYKEAFESRGLKISGTLDGGALCEIAELAHHPWMVGVQFHPEFKSKPTAPHPLFLDFIDAALKCKEKASLCP
ncbi:MAG: CTP synthase [Chlamydiae bacterium GWC2_50_10]|nr:MAG: CTP synthase [Chlamydiae bacterium GWA2_50_15]OGN53724.1 MAG: CTP synthase [Chlamydiae bacterium GWC2_50_10]OGN58223.1 MAG: CTP synthase [Chlamydiae bacterium RIFCSPHIGHO2_02_FULL_49_29]OGN68944.1 MAG: CTP synthase [Chlamydiae bacterium RIFCSPLOWO2_02_FULL_49_12]OGN71714.1 MAG: CTP synthase [Chlamydiae bacterium RIFCSPLOWO2_12_FULL_49_12]HAZ15681.1 CTP synthetase [Parachlamydiales bacterium]